MSNSITPQKTNCNKKNIQIPFNPPLAGLLRAISFRQSYRRKNPFISKKFSKNNDKTKKNQLRFYPKLILRIISETIIHLPDKIRLKFQKRLATLPKRLPVHERES